MTRGSERRGGADRRRTDRGDPGVDLAADPGGRTVETPADVGGRADSAALVDRALYALFARHADRERHRSDRRHYRGGDLTTDFETLLARSYGLSWLVALLVAGPAAGAVGTRLDRVADGLSQRGAAHDRVYRVATNDTAAAAVARDDCPGGEHRRFGTCRAVGGVVVQRRVGVWTVVAVAVDLRIDGPDGRVRATFVLRPYR